MKIYPLFLVFFMMINFGLMAYLNKNNLKKFLLSNTIGLFSYFPLTFYILTEGNLDLNTKQYIPFTFIFILILGIQFFICYKLYCFKFSYFILYWTLCARILGFLPKDNFGEGWTNLFVVCGYTTFVFLWFFFLRNYGKIYQKIILLLLSIILCSCLIDPPFFKLISFIGGGLFSPLFFCFFAIGEILLFIDICYQMLYKDSNPQSHSPKDS